jgi:hypothetical protein
LPAARAHHGGTVWNNRLYATGGITGGAQQSTVYVSPQLIAGGNISSGWTTATSLNVPRSGHASIAYANNLYTLGGYDGTNYLSDVQFNQINADGSLDSWVDTTSLPQRIRQADGFAANGYMYLFGGRSDDNTCTNNTYVTPISANTTIASGNNPTGVGEWFVTNERFASPRYAAAAAYDGGKTYVLGGGCKGLATGSSVDILEDDFDPSRDVADWVSVTAMDNGTNCGVIAAGNSLVSTGGNTAAAVTINTDVRFGGTVNFSLRIPTNDTATCDPPESGEDLLLQYSNNNGLGWTTIATYNEANFNTATAISENIPAAAQTAATRFRWTMPAADGSDDEWAIDSLVIRANTAAPATQIMEDDFDPTIDAIDWTTTAGMAVGTACGTVTSGNSLASTGSTASAETINFNMPLGGTVAFDLLIPAGTVGTCSGPNGTEEDLLLQYSTNNGGAWTTMATYQEDVYSTTSTLSAILPDLAKSATTRFRWTIPNADAGVDEWAIDNVKVSATDAPVILKSSAHRATLSTLQAQPQVAKYSRMIDTDTDVFPTKWLMNGIDNSVGARWNMTYRSSTNVTANWGQDTNFGTVTLGQPENYIARDTAGTNTNFARYYYMSISIDSSQAYGYPDDVTRGPTVNDITLFFTSDPSRRLRHGKTFTGGELQPLDTPFP